MLGVKQGLNGVGKPDRQDVQVDEGREGKLEGEKTKQVTALTFQIIVSLFSPSVDLDASKDNEDSEPEHLMWRADPPLPGAVQVK